MSSNAKSARKGRINGKRTYSFEIHALRRLRAHLSEELGYFIGNITNDKRIELFAKHYNLTIIGDPVAWVTALYKSGKHTSLKFVDGQFLKTAEWQILRKLILTMYGTKCMKCGTDDGRPNVDHIKPREHYPHLEKDFHNLQVLCGECNRLKTVKKSNKLDYRPKWAKKKYPLPIKSLQCMDLRKFQENIPKKMREKYVKINLEMSN